MREGSDNTCSVCGEAYSAGTEADSGDTLCAECQSEATVVKDVKTENDDCEEATIIGIASEVACDVAVSGLEYTESNDNLRIGRFEIVEVLGQGAFGKVYKAHDPVLDREVALKVPKINDSDIDEFAAFVHEAKAAARLRHPNIVAVFECGTTGDQPFIASEFVDGTPLSDILKKSKLEIREAVNLLRQIAEAIDYAHSEGIVHRDLKPANIMMSNSGRPQVMDFGLARLGSDAETSMMTEGSIVGTPAYMAPEQAQGDRSAVGPKSDQYSVGVLMYVMLSGKKPYSGDAWSVISQVANPDIQPKAPHAISSDVPSDLEACCMKAMENSPNNRYDSLLEMAEDLECWLDGRPLRARPLSHRERLMRWCVRNKAIATLLSIISVLICTASIVGFSLAIVFNDLAVTAESARDEAEILLLDNLAERGLAAGRDHLNQEAMLWFGNAVELSENHPDRHRLNRARFNNFLKQSPTRIRLLPAKGTRHHSVIPHPYGQFLLSEQSTVEGNDCQIWNLQSGEVWNPPTAKPISAATWCSNGSQIVIADDSSWNLFDFPSGTLVHKFPKNEKIINLLVTSEDDRWLAVSQVDASEFENHEGDDSDTREPNEGSLTVYDLKSPQRVGKTLAMRYPVRSIVFSPDGRTLVTYISKTDQNSEGEIQTWKLDPGELDLQQGSIAIECDNTELRPDMEFVNDVRLIVTVYSEDVRCVDIGSGETIWSVPKEKLTRVCVSPDRRRVAIMEHFELNQVDAETGEQLVDPTVHPNQVYSLAYSPDGSRILTGCADQMARIIEAKSGQILHSLQHSDMIDHVVWFADGKAFAIAEWSAGVVHIWNAGAASSDSYSRELPAGTMHVVWSDDGEWFVATGMDLERGPGACTVFRTSDGATVNNNLDYSGRVSDACFVPGTTHLFLGGAESIASDPEGSSLLKHQDLGEPGLIAAYDVLTGELLFEPIVTDSNVTAMAASPDGKLVLALCEDLQLLLLDPVTGVVTKRIHTHDGSYHFGGYVIFRRLLFSPLGDRFAVWGTISRNVEIRNSTDGELLYTIEHENPEDNNIDWIHDVRFSPDGNNIATCSANRTVQLWHSENGDPWPLVLEHSDWVFTARFTQDGKRLLTCSRDKQARLWKLDDPDEPLVWATPAQSDEAYACCFLPGEERCLVGLRNGIITAWDVASGKQVSPATSEDGQGAIYTLEVSPDYSRVLDIGRDANVRCFPITRWQDESSDIMNGHEIKLLAEIYSGHYQSEGVLTRLTNQMLIQKWKQLFTTFQDHPMFEWHSDPKGSGKDN